MLYWKHWPAYLKSQLKWKLAKFGWKLIRIWIVDQDEIDGDTVQVEEILNEWVNEIINDAHVINSSRY